MERSGRRCAARARTLGAAVRPPHRLGGVGAGAGEPGRPAHRRLAGQAAGHRRRRRRLRLTARAPATGVSTMASKAGPLDITFTATLGKVQVGDTWTCVKLPDSAAIFG